MPLGLMVGWLAMLAAGAFGSGSAHASSLVTVTGTVDKTVQLDTTACSGAGVLDFGTGGLVPDDPYKTTAHPCTVTFGSNNSPLGADLQVMQDPAAGAGPAMKCVSAGCSGDSIADHTPAGGPAFTSPHSDFGMYLTATGGGASNVWSMGTGTPPASYPVAGTASTACQTASLGSGTCAFHWEAQASSATDQVGSYAAQVRFVALAR
jgi:hypothetical protein